jgi:hypothetical protein
MKLKDQDWLAINAEKSPLTSEFRLTAHEADLIVLKSRCATLDLTARALLREIVRTPAITLGRLFNYYSFIAQAQLAGAPYTPLKAITVEQFNGYITELRDLGIIKIARRGDGETAPEIADIHDDWWPDAVTQALDETPPKPYAGEAISREERQQYANEASRFLDLYSKLPQFQMRSVGEVKNKERYEKMRFEAIKELVDNAEEDNEELDAEEDKRD